MKFEVIHDEYQVYIAAPVACARCLRHFRAGQRVRMVVAGPVERIKYHHALVNQRVSQQYWEHENPDHCTEPQ